MKLKSLTIVLALTLLLTSNVNAGYISPTTQILNLMSKLSDDIGTMADRILDMGEQIGVMADRIVETEELMADLTVNVAALQANGSDNSSVGTVLISQTTETVLYEDEAPQFSTNSNTTEMLVYVSSSMTMDSNTISILVKDADALQANWANLKTLAKDNKIYIAVKTIDGNTISSLSNVLTYSTLY